MRRPLLVIGFLCLIATGIRVFFAWNRLLWLDEIQTVIYLRQGLRFIVGIARPDAVIDVHPPFYYILLWAWSQFCRADMWLRLLSIILGIASLPLLYALMRELEIRKGGFATTLILSFSVPHIVYSAEIRMYSLTVLLTLLSMFLYLVWFRQQRWWAALLWLIVTTSGCYTYHFFAFVPFAQGIHCLVTSASAENRRRLLSFIVLTVLLCVAYVPGLLKLSSQAAFVSSDYWGLSPSFRDLVALLFWYASGASFRGNVTFQAALAGSWLLLFILGWFSKELLLSRKVLLAMWFFVPPLVVFVLSQRTPLFQYRYFLPGLPVFLLMVGLGFSSLRRTAAKVLFASVLTITGLTALLVNWQPPDRVGMEPVLELVDSRAAEGATVFHLVPTGGSGETYVIARYYRPEWRQWIVGTHDDISREARPAFSPTDFLPSIDERMIGEECFWCVVMTAFLPPGGDEFMVGQALPSGMRIVSRETFTLVSVYRCCPDEISPRDHTEFSEGKSHEVQVR